MHTINEWLELLSKEWAHVDAIQLAVLILGVTEVFLARANSVYLYPAGIGATVLAIYSLFTVGLYAECLLHGYYVVMSIYGWWYWNAGRDHKPVQVTLASKKDWIVTLAIVLVGFGVLYLSLSSFTDSEVPVWDAWVSATGWAGMWLLARRKVENWILLNISNAFAIPLLFHKSLPMLGLLTIVLFVVACFGYFDWLKTARRNLLQKRAPAS